MSSPIARFRTALRRFGRARRGSAAVEFSIVALPFFFLILGLAEIGLLGLAQSSLNFAVAETGREIRTGQAQMSGVTAQQIESRICTRLNRFMNMNCVGTLFVDVDRFNSFVEIDSQNSPIVNGEIDTSGFGYNPGAASDIVVVRVFYRWSVVTPMFQAVLGNVSGGDRMLISTMMFRNEPFQ